MKVLLVIIFVLKFSISYNQTFIPLNTDIVNISTYDKEEDGIYLGEPLLSPLARESLRVLFYSVF